MFCKHCGAELADDTKFCQACGKPVRNWLKPFAIYPPNAALLLGFIAWLADQPRQTVIYAAVGGALVGLVMAVIAVAVQALFGKRL